MHATSRIPICWFTALGGDYGAISASTVKELIAITINSHQDGPGSTQSIIYQLMRIDRYSPFHFERIRAVENGLGELRDLPDR